MAFWPTSVATDAQLYIAVNSLQTTLSGSIDNIVTTITLASTTGFPTAGGVTIDNEVIFYTGISGAQLTGATRGADGTTAASHASGVPVGATIIAFHHNGLMAEIEAIESSLNLTASQAVVTNASGRVTTVAVTPTEVGYLAGVTSSIQTQLNATISNPATSPVQFQLGSQGAPSITFVGDTDLGIFSSGTDTLNFTTNGVSRMSLDTADLTLNLPILGTFGIVTAPGYAFSGSPGTGMWAASAGELRFSTAGILAISVSSSQNVTLAGSLDTATITHTGGTAIKGTNTNNNAAAGDIGEYIESVITSLTSFGSSGVYGDLTSISLTAGDWDVDIFMLANANGGTGIVVSCGISTTSGNSTTGLQPGSNQVENAPGPVAGVSQSSNSIPSYRVSLSGTTTVYFKYEAAFSGNTPKAEGRISARRRR